MNTYLYEVTYKKEGIQSYCTVRATDELDAVQEVCANHGDITPVSVSRIRN